MTPLHIACTRTDLQVIQFLLEEGAAVDAVTHSSFHTPLQVGELIPVLCAYCNTSM